MAGNAMLEVSSVTSCDTEKYLEDWEMLESIGIRPRPTWVRGPAFVDGNEIVLPARRTEEYVAFEPDHSFELLSDLVRLPGLGEVYFPENRLDIKITNPRLAEDFANKHGLLWHGPKQVRDNECRESLKDWFFAGFELGRSATLYAIIERCEEGSAEPVRQLLRRDRDAGLFHRFPLPDDDNDLLEYASIQLAESITRGLAECTPTLSAMCALLEDGAKVGGVGDFRFGNEAGSLVGAAYYELAHLISRKAWVTKCDECGEMLIPEDARQRYHKKCGARKRQRERRARMARGQQ